MPRLTDFLRGYAPFEQIVAAAGGAAVPGVAPGAAGAAVAGAPGPGRVEAAVPTFAQAYVIAGLLQRSPWRERPIVVVAPAQEAAGDLEHELGLYCPERPVTYLPPRGVWYGSEGEVKPRVAGRRARAVAALRSGPVAGRGPAVVVVEATTLMEGVVPPAIAPVTISVGSEYEFDALAHRLVELGYVRVDQVEDAGEFSIRGGIIDVFPATEPHPVRVEFWGDEVESLRSFSVYSQRSLGPLQDVTLHAAGEEPGGRPQSIVSLLREETYLIRTDPVRAATRLEAFQSDMADVIGDAAPEGAYSGRPQVEKELGRFPAVTLSSLGTAAEEEPSLIIRGTSGEMPVTNLPEAEEAIRRLVDEGYRVVIAFEQRAEAERAGYVLRRVTGTLVAGGEIDPAPGVSFLPVPHRRHFVIPDLKLALLTDALIFPRRHKAVGVRRPPAGLELSSFRDLRKGDYIVHEDHGVGRFEGISTKTVAGVTRDYLDLAYRDNDMLYVPHDQISKVMRYVGAGGTPPSLSKLGGKSWEYVKSRVRRAARHVAGELLHLYALRQATKGYRFSEDTEWQVRFEKAFPYEETEDQQRAIDVVKDDMESQQPMDRLLCGDVGYGKTEVALRAAFKATLDGKQAMVLVPTTILAQQHYGTFRERFSEFPVKVEMISRFRSPAEQKRILKDFKAGRVDVLIGTHRLLSQDVEPKDLGLVIVDEEQRFGVTQKEALRRLKVKVDVLTLTATPIPRTLQMSLSGVRDITIIETPPRDRHPIQTYVGLYDEGMVKRAIEREIDRGGQVYYLHNRVETIDRTAARLRELMPRVRFAIAHGQMAEQDLERVMLEFLRRDSDVLVTTTIIESGLDIPNANTLIVERADLLGLAQLYQIRGRIGRSSRVAHAFLFHPDEAVLTEEAAARLSTLADYTELGSGFKIAMRDLEIRGAGELLGEEQSGHIAAVGFEMYLSMLQEETARLQGEEVKVEKVPRVELGIDAHVPTDFIGYEAARVDLHRRIASAGRLDELADLRAELTDRFGAIPEPVDNLIFLGEVRVTLQNLGADALSVKQSRLLVSGLHLPPGSRERLRGRDRRYVYAPVQGQLSLGLKGDERGLRRAVREVLDDILGLFSGENPSEATK
ncbi:MAG: transcription-repair coupling factor [Actinomycetia bacterium]|nr:transcription-repair coupling factor [Actinomycetes bacterium]